MPGCHWDLNPGTFDSLSKILWTYSSPLFHRTQYYIRLHHLYVWPMFLCFFVVLVLNGFHRHYYNFVHFPLNSASKWNFRNAENRNPGLLGEWQECYLCAMQPTLPWPMVTWWAEIQVSVSPISSLFGFTCEQSALCVICVFFFTWFSRK